jgi:hypothetical protein
MKKSDKWHQKLWEMLIVQGVESTPKEELSHKAFVDCWWLN